MDSALRPRSPLHAEYRARAMRRGWRSMDAALRRPCAYPHPAGRVARIETHISVIYLAGRYAYKIIKPVDLGFADFSARETRYRCCREALRLNRRLAGPLYLDVVSIVGVGPTFRIGSSGKPLDHAVKMIRFDERNVFSALLAHGALGVTEMNVVADRLAAFHRRASQAVPKSGFGSSARVGAQMEAILESLAREAPLSVSRAVQDWCRTETTRLAAHFVARRAEGFVRACHGDLHLDNMVRRGCDVLMFDCIEFSDALRWIDVTSDLAFALMDLLARGRGDLAGRLLNRWLTLTGDFGGLRALRFYVVYRALVRALVAVLKSRGSHAGNPPPDATRYLRLVERTIAPPSVFLLLCHGFSGSGKSVASEALAPQIGAIRVSSDIERKRQKPFATPDDRPLPLSAYTRDAIHAHYERLLALTDTLLETGYPVIVDAGFLKHEHRTRFIELGRTQAIPVFILDFHAGATRLAHRVRIRATNPGEPSDADESVLKTQTLRADPLTLDESAMAITVDTEVPLGSFEHPAFWHALRKRLAASGWIAPVYAMQQAKAPSP
jgi:aminoglycoside phosphotransferase family enzyme/predicted kinase